MWWLGLVRWVLWHINLCRLFNAKSILCKYSVLFKTIQFSVSTQFNCQKHFYFKLFKQLYITIQFSLSTVSMSKTVQFQIIQFSIAHSLNVIGLYTPINYFGRYATCSHKDSGRSIFSLGKPLAGRTTWYV